MKHKKLNILIPLFGRNIEVIYHTDSIPKSYPEMTDGARGETLTNNGSCLIYLREGCPVDTVVHECLHATWHCLAFAGVVVDVDNHEVLAYSLGEVSGKAVRYYYACLEAEKAGEVKAKAEKVIAEVSGLSRPPFPEDD